MRFHSKIIAMALCASLQACVTPPAAAPAPPTAAAVQEARTPVTILISIDGFRTDYLQRGVTPNLSALAARGISAAMRPAFPSKTFPNHWTIITGERPDRNGIVSNSMEDSRRPAETFTMATDDPFWWSEAKPLWVDAEQAGIRTATMFWPGGNVAWGGTLKQSGHSLTIGGARPEDWMQFNQAITGAQRVAGVLDWMRRPASIRPRFVTLYFDTVDSAGHDFGPDDARTTAAVADADAQIGTLLAGLSELGQPANLVIVADHGMAATSSERTIAIDTIANPADYRIFETGPFAALSAVPGHEAALEKALFAKHDHLQCWRKSDIPARFQYGSNPRIQPYFCLAETGWETAKTTPDKPKTGGDHGYDNMAPEMRALFIASGPAIKPLGTVPVFDNVDVYPLLRDLLGLPPASGVDGNDAPFRAAIRQQR